MSDELSSSATRRRASLRRTRTNPVEEKSVEDQPQQAMEDVASTSIATAPIPSTSPTNDTTTFDLSSLAAATKSPSPPAAMTVDKSAENSTPTSTNSTTTPAIAAIEADTVVSSDGTFGSESKYDRLHHLLDQTSLFSKFLSEKMPARYTAINEKAAASSAKSNQQKASHLAERTASLKELIPRDSGLELQPFQVSGIDWLISLYENGLNGILADEMGLGKTIQVILFLAHLRRHRVFGPFLVVGPLGTLNSWRDEFKRWTPEIPVLLYHGQKDARGDLRPQFLTNSATPDAAYPVVLTSYEVAMRDEKFLKHVHWKMLVVDEGHRLKNMECLLLQKLKSLPSENRLLLTGTPLQNSLPELWSLLHFLLPDVFASLSQFQSWFDFDERSLEHSEGQQYLINQERDFLLVSKLHSILRPFVLRRVKSDVLKHLAEKKEYIIYTPMSATQRLYYQAILDGSMSSMMKNNSSSSSKLSNILMQLRKVVNHPYLLLSDQEEARLGLDMEKRALNPTPLDASESKDSSHDLEMLHRHLARKSTFIASDHSDDEVDEDASILDMLEELGEESSEDEEEEEEEYKDSSARKKKRTRVNSSTSAPTDEMEVDEEESFETITQRNKRRKSDQAVILAELKKSMRRSKSTPSTHTLSFDHDPMRLIRVCGKLQFLDQILPELHKRGSRVLIFSQMTRMLDIIEDYLILRGAPVKYQYCRLDGSTKPEVRAKQIAAFNAPNSSCFIFLLSTRAGGLGLNLAAADTVILYDTDFNPTVDAQAADRAHRFTQQKKVLVFRLITPGSVEIGMVERAESKKKLEQVVLTKGRFHQRSLVNSNDTAAASSSVTNAVPSWRQQEGIVSELMELFKMQPGHKLHSSTIQTQLDDRTVLRKPSHLEESKSNQSGADATSTTSSTTPTPTSATTRRRTSLKRKSRSSEEEANEYETKSNGAAVTTTSAFNPAWLTRILDREIKEPAPDQIPPSSYEAGYAFVTQHKDEKGLMHMLTEHQ